MQRQSILTYKAFFNFGRFLDGQYDSRIHSIFSNSLPVRSLTISGGLKATIPYMIRVSGLESMKFGSFKTLKTRSVAKENQDKLSDEDDELCPVECVREFRTDEEFLRILEKAEETNSLVVVDFYRTACGSCKYIDPIFSKLCKGSGDEGAEVIFLKHNVIDEYDEQSEVAERLRIKAVPLFHFYKNGVLLEAFPTRDKDRIIAAIHKYTATASPDV
ncbi:thioredoxin-like 4, chloroplastic [Diospyros lotus]|uniref:thioredoxin-like 4, chloroplastic n=1 Tax=Diospyros lotus TaxID=55363 RepID=UPI00225A0D7D|nr:thioredoxin-like 4, chloroplastic [Diospyros lotus]XP_052188611.1 thioredoxin-like 4, chloroplastic [Diospyros lotus]